MSDTLTVVGRRTTARPRLRLADLVAALSLGIDLGFGQPMEHVLRQCLIALRIADHVRLTEDDRFATYYTALLVDVGCHTDAHEQAKWFGDDIALKSRKFDYDMRSVANMIDGLKLLGSQHQPVHRFRVGLEFLVSGHREVDGMVESHSKLARALARELALPHRVQDAVGAAYERWDGRGWPGDLQGEDVPLPARLAHLAEFVEVAHRMGGVPAAVALANERSGRQFDPILAATFIQHADAILGDLDEVPTWDSVIAVEPSLAVRLTDEQADRALTGVADFVDLKSPYTLGHARAVSALAAGAGSRLGLDHSELVLLRRAGLVQGFGRLGISNAILDKPGRLAAGERERVRMQPYLTERMLQQSAWLAPLGAVAVKVRERLDGSGYPRGLAGSALGRPARILAAADVYQALVEPRPHRPARSADDAARELRREVGSGRLDGAAVEAVLAMAGHAVGRRRDHPAGLTAREVNVLRLLARGLSSRQIAERLVISPKTARNHIEHIYEKIGATSRATASLFAMQQGLVPEQEYDAAGE